MDTAHLLWRILGSLVEGRQLNWYHLHTFSVLEKAMGHIGSFIPEFRKIRDELLLSAFYLNTLFAAMCVVHSNASVSSLPTALQQRSGGNSWICNIWRSGNLWEIQNLWNPTLTILSELNSAGNLLLRGIWGPHIAHSLLRQEQALRCSCLFLPLYVQRSPLESKGNHIGDQT